MFDRINEQLLAVAEDARGDLTTIYIKYTAPESCGLQPYAVLWVKKSTELVLGLALPEGVESELLVGQLAGLKYEGLTKYMRLQLDDQVPDELGSWVAAAFRHVKGA